MGDILTLLKGMFCGNNNVFSDFESFTIIKSYILFLVFAIICCTPTFSVLSKKLSEKALSSNVALIGYAFCNIFR